MNLNQGLPIVLSSLSLNVYHIQKQSIELQARYLLLHVRYIRLIDSFYTFMIRQLTYLSTFLAIHLQMHLNLRNEILRKKCVSFAFVDAFFSLRSCFPHLYLVEVHSNLKHICHVLGPKLKIEKIEQKRHYET